MNDENISKVYLLSVPLENDYKNTLYFTNKSNQENYFQSKVIDSYTNFTYQRKDNLIYIPDHIDNIYNCNYVMYQNSKYSNKWFYAFIKEMKYENNECTIIEIETDVIQSWLFDYIIKPSFVEREHVSDDAIGLHTVPEGVETGELITNEDFELDVFGECVPCMAVTELPGDTNPFGEEEYFTQYTGLFQGCFFITGNENSILGAWGSINDIIKYYDNKGKADAIQSIFMVPTILTQGSRTFTIVDSGSSAVTYGVIPKSSEAFGVSFMPRTKPTTINGYTPRNKKLLTYPYCYLNLDNNAGSCTQYKYEDFNQSEYTFSVEMCLVPGISAKIFPNSYQGIVNNYLQSSSVGKLPICSWSSDVYTNWLTQNGVNIALSVGSSLLTTVGGLAMAGTGAGALMGGSTAVSGAMGIAQTLGQVHQQSLAPRQLEGNINCGDVNYGADLYNPRLYDMSIKKEYAEIIDGYFDMFGYKVNKIKIPNKAHRSRYWYTKTIDINIDGSIPQNDMQKIKNAYNNGITFWRNASEMSNYELSNDIV